MKARPTHTCWQRVGASEAAHALRHRSPLQPSAESARRSTNNQPPLGTTPSVPPGRVGRCCSTSDVAAERTAQLRLRRPLSLEDTDAPDFYRLAAQPCHLQELRSKPARLMKRASAVGDSRAAQAGCRRGGARACGYAREEPPSARQQPCGVPGGATGGPPGGTDSGHVPHTCDGQAYLPRPTRRPVRCGERRLQRWAAAPAR
jgi:hypothetical protein